MSKKIYRLSIVLLLSASAGAAHAGVFKCTRADGKTAFQDQPCAANESSKVINVPSSSQRESTDPLMAAPSPPRSVVDQVVSLVLQALPEAACCAYRPVRHSAAS